MITLRKIRRRLRALFRRDEVERELDDEIRFHLEMEAEKLRRQGLGPAEARRRARLRFGAVERFREESRDARGVRPVEDLIRDLRLGARVLLGRPGFTAVVLATLGLGVGGSAAIFGAVDGILLSPLPYPEAERLVTVWETDPGAPGLQEVAPANFLDWRERADSFEWLVAAEPFGLDWLRPEGPVALPTWLVSEGFFEAAGVPALHGRTFAADEHAGGRATVVVLGHELWRTRFGGDPEVVGRVLDLEGTPFQVVGVMPRGFALPTDDAVWAPKTWQGWEARARTSRFYRAYGRLEESVGLQQARAEMGTLAAQLAREYPAANADTEVALVPLPEQILGGVRRALMLLLGAVGLVLVVVIANIASMQLARAVGRGREFAVRGALGASRRRLAAELLTENLLLAAAGTGLGFGLAHLALGFLRSMAPAGLPRVHRMQADGSVLLFAAAVSLVAVLATGMLPVLLATRARLSTSLTEGGRGSTGGRWVGRAQGGLVVAQVCLSLMLLIGAGLLVRSFVSLITVDRGFRTEGIVAGVVQAHYDEAARRIALAREVAERLEARPGVASVGVTSALPFLEEVGPEKADLSLPERPPGPDESPPRVDYAVATSGYFETLDIPLLAGRLFDSRDGAEAPPVALVSESFVRTYWPDEEPLGRRLTAAMGRPVERQVVGVVGDVRRQALDRAPTPAVYVPRDQHPLGVTIFVVRGSGDAEELLEALRQAIWEVEPTLPVSPEASLAGLVGESVHERRFLMALLGGFAVMALALAAAGIFGLMSYTIAERTREIGVRIALGAHQGDVVQLVLRQGGALAAAGIALGLVGATAVTGLLTGMLYRVAPLDPPTFAGAALLLLVTALVASALPAWRAAGTDPVRALQVE